MTIGIRICGLLTSSAKETMENEKTGEKQSVIVRDDRRMREEQYTIEQSRVEPKNKEGLLSDGRDEKWAGDEINDDDR